MTTDEVTQRRIEWIKALRSGKFGQTRGVLRYGNTYCCLGVACELAHLKGLINREPDRNGEYIYSGSGIGFASSMQTLLAVDGLEVNLSFSDRSGDQMRAASLNDSARLNFDQIADVLAYEFGLDA